nr:hypothetical protein [Actinomadura sp. J1-007]
MLAARESRSSSTAPATRIVPGNDGRAAAALIIAASGPLASAAPRPASRSRSRRTGSGRSTVSRWPRSITTGPLPAPMSPITLPASSRRAARPRSFMAFSRKRASSSSRPDGEGMDSMACSRSTGVLM